MLPAKPKVLVAMSGGVDSSVAAAMLLRQGFDVVGCFMRLGSPGEEIDQLTQADEPACAVGKRGSKAVKIGHQGCCSINDAADARLVAAELGIPFYVVNFKKDFGRIIDYFVEEYAAGRTPNPCVRCNDWLKFGKLHAYASQIGAGFIASGHYARIGRLRDGTPALLRGVDQTKDQSYVLFGVPRGQLTSMMLPIGEMEKTAVRELAKSYGLPTFDKPDSQEICFVPDNDYAGLVERRRPEVVRKGQILDELGRALGSHGGQHRFTIGQRKGLGIGSATADMPLFVLNKDAATNSVVVGPRQGLLSMSCLVGEANWLIDESSTVTCRDGLRVHAKYRYNTPPAAARIWVREPASGSTPSGRLGRFEVRFDEPQAAVAPGQAIVLYDFERPEVVLGGGWIEAAAK